jgi:hypothetical protein
VANNYSPDFVGEFTQIRYKKRLGAVFNIHKEDHIKIVKTNDKYLPVI